MLYMRKLRFIELEEISNITQLINLEAGIWVKVCIISETFVFRNVSMFLGSTDKIKHLLIGNLLHLNRCAHDLVPATVTGFLSFGYLDSPLDS